MMTKQEIFDRAFTGIWNQGGPAFNRCSITCMYRDRQTGRACAVGQLLPDELYTQELEGSDVWHMSATLVDPDANGWELQNTPLGQWLRDNFDFTSVVADMRERSLPKFVFQLQQIHDDAAISNENDANFLEQYATEMRALAIQHCLNAAVIDKMMSHAN